MKIVDLPHHQYSKYFEKTFGIEEASVTTEGQLIYSPDGYLPRTGMFNVQGNLLGNSIEIFETMVHVEGAENFISEMAGVDGLLSKDLLVEIFNSTMTLDKMKEMYYRHQEEKKEVKMTGRMNKIHKQVNMEPTKPTAHINIKVMGQEVKVFSYDDLYWLIDEIDNMNVIQLLTDVAKGTIILQIFFLFITIYSRIFYLRCPLLYLLPFHYTYPRLQKFIHLKTKNLDPFAFFGVIYLGHLSISLENIYVGYFISSNTFSFVSQVKGQ